MSFNTNELSLLALIDSFVSGAITAQEFENQYTISWRKHRDSDDSKSPNKDTQRYFDSVFSAVDAYCSDPSLIDDEDLDDQGLLEMVLSLKTIWQKSVLT
ncbi:colicin immunity domain-containing protein [Pantoea sp. 1.19]|uniref:colicin immunity domain-containing protein n=1 Tax=Pantoea sp. 1.19 TaxID=1925589 RepID=UPI00111516C4